VNRLQGRKARGSVDKQCRSIDSIPYNEERRELLIDDELTRHRIQHHRRQRSTLTNLIHPLLVILNVSVIDPKCTSSVDEYRF